MAKFKVSGSHFTVEFSGESARERCKRYRLVTARKPDKLNQSVSVRFGEFPRVCGRSWRELARREHRPVVVRFMLFRISRA